MAETIREGERVLLWGPGGKSYLLAAEPREFHTHYGRLPLEELIGRPWGALIRDSNGTPFYALRPTLYDHLLKVRRATQIIYPKEIGIILLKLDVRPGKTIYECGTGSGALTLALAAAVGEEGKVITYEREERFRALAQENLEKAGLVQRVIFKEALEEVSAEEADGFFLDVKEPWELLPLVWKALKGGAPLGALVPTTNQVTQLLKALSEFPFVGLEVQEILQRFYKTNPERLRPEDRMVAHTGYLLFARKVFEK